MLEHPGTELQVLIKEKGLTQKAFASILGKKVSEVNELLKGKRNITIQRDYLLHQTLGTPIKYWILKQVDYDYSLIDIDEEKTDNNPGSVSITDQYGNKEQNENKIEPGLNGTKDTQDSSEQTPQNDNNTESLGTQGRIQENVEQMDSSANKGASEGQTEPQKTPIQKLDSKDDEDFRNRAKIFKSF